MENICWLIWEQLNGLSCDLTNCITGLNSSQQVTGSEEHQLLEQLDQLKKMLKLLVPPAPLMFCCRWTKGGKFCRQMGQMLHWWKWEVAKEPKDQDWINHLHKGLSTVENLLWTAAAILSGGYKFSQNLVDIKKVHTTTRCLIKHQHWGRNVTEQQTDWYLQWRPACIFRNFQSSWLYSTIRGSWLPDVCGEPAAPHTYLKANVFIERCHYISRATFFPPDGWTRCSCVLGTVRYQQGALTTLWTLMLSGEDLEIKRFCCRNSTFWTNEDSAHECATITTKVWEEQKWVSPLRSVDVNLRLNL